MADTMEIDETITTTNKEPVKNEESATSTSNNDGRNEEANSPPPNCSICLGKLINTSFTDSCLHQFCFTCLLQWSRIKTECPLCKQTFKSIIHNVRSEEDYDQYHVPRELAQPPQASQVFSAIELNFNVERAPMERRRFAYRTTMLHNRFLQIRLNSGQDPLRNIPSLSREERRNRRTNPIAYRRNIYRTGEWSNPFQDIYSRFHECSAEYYRRHPQEHGLLIPWINRELLTLLNANQAHIAYVSRVIMDTLVRYDMRSQEFHEAIRPYFNVHTTHFIHELMNYARSTLSVSDYDAVVTYSPCNSAQVAGLSGGYWNRVQSPITSSNSNSSASDDSDVRVVEHVDNANIELPRPNIEIPLTFSELFMPGPSTVSETFQVNGNNNNNNINNNNVAGGIVGTRPPCVLTILSSASSDSDECEVVGYVKPRHERTPEIIELVSSDDEGIVTNDNVDELESPPKTSTATPLNDENPCTSNANNEKNNTKNNQKPKTNYVKLHNITTASLSSSGTIFDSDSDSDFVVRPVQRRNSCRNAKRNVKKSDNKTTRKSLRKRNKNSTGDSIDGKRESKRRRNSNGISNRNEKNVATIISSDSENENDTVKDNGDNGGGWHKLKVRKDLMTYERRRNNSRSSSSSSDESSSSSSSSTSSTSTSSTSTTSHTTSTTSNIFGSTTSLNSNNSINNQLNDDKIRKKNKFSRTNNGNKLNKNSNQCGNDKSTKKKSSRPKLKSTVIKCQRPVNSTVLRKDVDKKEWYIDNNRQSRSRSRSRSSYESSRDNLRKNSRRQGDHHHHHRRRRRSNSNNPMENHRERRMALRMANEKLKNQSLYSTADSQNDDDDDDDEIDVGNDTQYNYERSNSQSSTISEKHSNSTKNDEHNSKYKNNDKKKYIKESKNGNSSELLNVASTSTSTQKYFDSKNIACGKKRSSSNKMHKKMNNKDSKQRRMSSSSKPKSKRDKRHRIRSFSSSSSSSLLSSTSSSSSSD